MLPLALNFAELEFFIIFVLFCGGGEDLIRFGEFMINFEFDDVVAPELDFGSVREWIADVTASRGFEVGRLFYRFCDDLSILEANRKFLGHDYFTDIITFDYTRGTRLSGDMIISLDTVASNATSLGVAVNDELLRVIIHGVLHLCGIDDKGPGEREIMERAENDALRMLPPALAAY